MTQYPFPRDSEIKRVFPWSPLPEALKACSLAGTAYHEAGHVVFLEWVGLPVRKATATASDGGRTLFEIPAIESAGQPESLPEHLAGVAAAFHAGICAELIHAGISWDGIVRRDDMDWKMAAEVLHPTFGPRSSGHGYAQRLALAVLSARWARVTEVAQEMIERGSWEAAGFSEEACSAAKADTL
ncbi:hypothetical protein [Zoogloea sp. LCSB751]|uniref:hypothetical protein n=1 Tax=Zoogloea sp. LCSB751 TaxID=1965277 RepID=UPI0009A50371|nr:hypothetical protein [Zoogloea sp. LCSB751]